MSNEAKHNTPPKLASSRKRVQMKVSVCLATYNGESFILSQLESLLKQLSPTDEVIISDDSSTDRTVDMIKSIKDPRIVLYADSQFRSPIRNFEFALKKTEGDYIFLSDQDDIWLPNKVSIMLSLLKSYDLVVSDCEIINENGKLVEPSFFALRNSGPGRIKNLIKNTYLGCCMAFRRRILEIALPFPKDIPMHDIWIGGVAEWFGKTHFTAEKLVQYRRHGKNASPTVEESPFDLWQKIKFRYLFIKNLLHLVTKRG